MSFNDRTRIDTTEVDIVVLVGPNNVGKTRTLQEIQQYLALHPGQQIPWDTYFVLADVTAEKLTNSHGLQAWLRHHRTTWSATKDGRNEQVQTVAHGAGSFALQSVSGVWDNQDCKIGMLANHLIGAFWCGDRLRGMGGSPRPTVGSHPDNPISLLVQNSAMLESFCRAFQSAFGANVIVDGWQSNIVLRLSRNEIQDDFVGTTNDGLPIVEVVERLSRLPLIDSQSDGVRSFANIILTLLTSQFPIVLFDDLRHSCIRHRHAWQGDT